MSNPVLDFMATRRSRSPKTLTLPAPNQDEVAALLALASRSPDHKMLVPWRFVVLSGDDLARFADALVARGTALGLPADQVEKTQMVYSKSPLCVAVLYTPVETDAIPEAEQVLAVGGVCRALVDAALASGWGAGWVTGWAAFDAHVNEVLLGGAANGYVAGLVHIGTETVIPGERKRPDLAEITRWGLA